MCQSRPKGNIFAQARRPASTKACRGNPLWSPVSIKFDCPFSFFSFSNKLPDPVFFFCLSRLSSLFPQSSLRIASNPHIGEFPDKYCISGMVYLTRPWGILGLWGFTVTFRVTGFTTRSMSSIGTTPINTESPRTRAPVKLVRLAKFT